jgi:hypothetical protein
MQLVQFCEKECEFTIAKFNFKKATSSKKMAVFLSDEMLFCKEFAAGFMQFINYYFLCKFMRQHHSPRWRP